MFSWLQKLYIVCDVALFVIANKSTACHLDSPKDPVLPSKFFLVQDKAIHTHTCSNVDNVFVLTQNVKLFFKVLVANECLTFSGLIYFHRTLKMIKSICRRR